MDFPENIAIQPMDMFGSCNFEAFEMSLEADKHMRWLEKKIEQHGGGDAQWTTMSQHLFYFLKEEREELEKEMKNSECKIGDNVSYVTLSGFVLVFIWPFILILEMWKCLDEWLHKWEQNGSL